MKKDNYITKKDIKKAIAAVACEEAIQWVEEKPRKWKQCPIEWRLWYVKYAANRRQISEYIEWASSRELVDLVYIRRDLTQTQLYRCIERVGQKELSALSMSLDRHPIVFLHKCMKRLSKADYNKFLHYSNRHHRRIKRDWVCLEAIQRAKGKTIQKPH